MMTESSAGEESGRWTLVGRAIRSTLNAQDGSRRLVLT